MYLARISRALLLGCVLSAPLAAQQTPENEAALIERLRSHNQDLAAYTRLYQLYATQGRKAEAIELRKQAKRSVVPTPVTRQKIGRNEPCPCGSGKKFKKCCGP